jgi:hypothetical protein
MDLTLEPQKAVVYKRLDTQQTNFLVRGMDFEIHRPNDEAILNYKCLIYIHN